jgi:iron complex outermembrane receptor protein
MKKIILLVLLLPLTILGQEITVKGTVLDKETNETLPGVPIIVKGTKKGTQTDFDGKFQLKAKIGTTLVFSYLGMKSREIPSTQEMKVFLEKDTEQLDEIVVSVGYFDVTKKDLSGSIAQVTTEQLEKNRATTIEQLIQGQVAGVVVNESAEPGGGIAISC